MTDILDLIDNATEQRCACGCRVPLDPDGPSAWFATEECQRRWGDAQATDPQDVYDRPDAGHEQLPRPACGHFRCAGLPYCRESPGLVHLREVSDRIAAEAQREPPDRLAWSAAIDRARAEVAAAYGIPEALVGSGCYESGPGPTASTITFASVDDPAGRFGYGEDRVTVRVRQQARFRADGVLEFGPLMMSTAPEWLARLFPEVDGWEQRRGEMWRTQCGVLLARDQWLYVLRIGDRHASVIVPAESAGSLEWGGAIERELRQMIRAQSEAT